MHRKKIRSTVATNLLLSATNGSMDWRVSSSGRSAMCCCNFFFPFIAVFGWRDALPIKYLYFVVELYTQTTAHTLKRTLDPFPFIYSGRLRQLLKSMAVWKVGTSRCCPLRPSNPSSTQSYSFSKLFCFYFFFFCFIPFSFWNIITTLFNLLTTCPTQTTAGVPPSLRPVYTWGSIQSRWSPRGSTCSSSGSSSSHLCWWRRRCRRQVRLGWEGVQGHKERVSWQVQAHWAGGDKESVALQR